MTRNASGHAHGCGSEALVTGTDACPARVRRGWLSPKMDIIISLSNGACPGDNCGKASQVGDGGVDHGRSRST